ncbi:MAG TPA: PAS domain S-box protein [Phycisphaerae bacterium]|nr:PAS domain S-box protein [Phycisphaerae bacterium]HOQ84516.1 PAS domain S-box protein [Phycisphaerae bacterium]HPU24567.1 PAS domain S-box protein [Phycisphaerae bacterium]HQA00665.1 PAS domain S-box protein [Phycisphaerae bacterium]
MKHVSPRQIAGRIALIYALFGVVWIALTDTAVTAIVEKNAFLVYVHTVKGWAFIFLTALLVYYLVRCYASAIEHSENELASSEERYRRIFETAHEGICTTDPMGRILLVNARFAQMVGRSVEELIGEPLLTLVDPESRHELAGRIQNGAASSTHPCDVKLCVQSGQEVWAMAAISPMFTDDGCHLGSLFMFTDISDRKRLESQVRQFQKLEAVGQLAGGVAHDFNNIVTAVLGNVDLMRLRLKRDPIPVESLSSDIDQIERAGERAMALTRQLLMFSRRQVVRPEIIDVGRLLSEMEKMLSRLIRDDIVLRVAVDEDVPFVRADAGQLEQVVVNLVVNARDAMPEGGQIVVKASAAQLDAEYAALHPDAQPGSYALIEVSDTGHGMDEATVQRVFEPFFTTKPAGKGTGLGLATAYGIIKQSGGHISVYSEPGIGSTFRVYLPATDECPEAEPVHQTAGPEVGGNETILVCEDNEAIRKLLCRVLKEKGYNVNVFGSPSAAIEFAQSYDGHIDLLITDVVMAGMNGPDLAETLQSTRPDLKVLYVSGYPSDVISHHGVLERSADFLSKPFTASALLQRVREVLDAAGVKN